MPASRGAARASCPKMCLFRTGCTWAHLTHPHSHSPPKENTLQRTTPHSCSEIPENQQAFHSPGKKSKTKTLPETRIFGQLTNILQLSQGPQSTWCCLIENAPIVLLKELRSRVMNKYYFPKMNPAVNGEWVSWPLPGAHRCCLPGSSVLFQNIISSFAL